jgi:hypothetical protein
VNANSNIHTNSIYLFIRLSVYAFYFEIFRFEILIYYFFNYDFTQIFLFSLCFLLKFFFCISKLYFPSFYFKQIHIHKIKRLCLCMYYYFNIKHHLIHKIIIFYMKAILSNKFIDYYYYSLRFFFLNSNECSYCS